MTQQGYGIVGAIAATAMWGLSPLYYNLLADVPAPEILAHRTVWSALIFTSLLAFQGGLRELPALTATRGRFGLLAIASLMISLNWGLFIYSIQAGRVTESSLGYYMMPLSMVFLGVLVFRERLDPVQGLAVALAVLAVAILTWGLGKPPWLPLTLAVSFALYGVIKKRLAAGPVASVSGELLLLTPLAMGWLVWVHASGEGAFGHDLRTSLLLAFSGVISALPLILFSAAARRVSMATLGLLQYLNPTLQFLCAVAIFREGFTATEALAFGLIWSGLALYSARSLRQEKARRRMDMASPEEAAL